MEILPIGSLSDTDKPIFNNNIFNLSTLKRLDFPVAEGIAVTAPEIILSTVLKFAEEADKETFEQRLTIVKSTISKIAIPQKLEASLKSNEKYYVQGALFDFKRELWQELLHIWLAEIRAKLWREGFKPGITLSLTPQVVLYLRVAPDVARAYFDPETEDVVIDSATKLSPSANKQINDLVILANRKLMIPQVYLLMGNFDRVKLLNVGPYTQSIPATTMTNQELPVSGQKKIIKTAMKLFLNLSSGFAISPNVDGLLIEGENSPDFDTLVFRLAEGALSYPTCPVIFKLPDIDDGQLSGAIRLLHRADELKSAADAYIFARHKKNLLNLEVAIPKVGSVDELLAVKRELSCMGISRKGTMKMWQVMQMPENLINLEDYLEAGLDGIILELDKMQEKLLGCERTEADLLKNHVKTLIKFVDPVFTKLHKARVPVLAKGALLLHPEVLDLLISNGVWGVVANNLIEAENMPETLSWTEKRMILKKENPAL